MSGITKTIPQKHGIEAVEALYDGRVGESFLIPLMFLLSFQATMFSITQQYTKTYP